MVIPDSGNERTCIFCSAVGPLTREHVLAVWTAEVLHTAEPDDPPPEWRSHYTAGGVVDRDRQHGTSRPGVVVRAVCESCNSGWMAGLEARVQPLLEPMIRGHRTALDPVQQVEVATWASKTVAAMEFHERTTVIMRAEDREVIRRELRPPHHHLVRLAHRADYTEALLVKTLVARSAGAADERPDTFVTVFVIGFLIVQVWLKPPRIPGRFTVASRCPEVGVGDGDGPSPSLGQGSTPVA